MPTIKSSPEDFRVEEVIEVTHKKDDCLIFTLEKRNENTISAARKIARALGLPFGNFGYAGLKDRRAVTRQRISVRGALEEDLRHLEIENIKISEIERGDRIRIGDHRGNRFSIVVRDVESVREPGRGFPNFFGKQRFGGNEEIGREIIRRNYEPAVKMLLTKEGMEEAIENEEFDTLLEQYPPTYEKSALRSLVRTVDYFTALKSLPPHILTLYVHAYQSYLFNELLRKRLEQHDLFEIAIGDIICTEKFEKKAYLPVTAAMIERAWREGYPPVLPIVGYKTRVYGATKRDLDELLENERITFHDFKMDRLPFLRSRGTYREIIGRYSDLRLNHENDTLFCEFFLPKGEYATVFIDYLLGWNNE